MNSVRVKIHIPKPCSENWEAMLPSEQGRFCLSCQKTVIDFTQKSEAEIIEYFSKHGSTCGRFYEDQLLNTPHSNSPFLYKWKSYIAAAFLTFGTNVTIITSAFAQTIASTVLTPASQQRGIKKEYNILPDGKLHLKGKVLNAADEKPLEGIKIYLQGKSEDKRKKEFEDGSVLKNEFQNFKTVTDKNGLFELVIPAVELSSYKQILYFEAGGYHPQRIALQDIDLSQPIVQYINKIERVLPPEYYGSPIRMGGGQTYSFFEGSLPKPYRSRAGILLAYAFSPVKRLKYNIMDRLGY